MVIKSVKVSGSSTYSASVSTTKVAVGGTSSLSVNFRPDKKGSFTGKVTVVTDSKTTPEFVLNVAGTGG